MSSATSLVERAEPKRELQVAVLFLGDDLERICAELILQARKIGAEDRAQHDLQGQFAGIVAEVDGLGARRLFSPACGEFVVDFPDQAAELIDDAAMKRGLHHSALPAPEVPLAGHDAVAEEDLDAVHPFALRVIAMVRQQHPLDVVRVVDHVVINAPCGGKDSINVAELGKVSAQASQRLVAAAEIEAFGGAGGQA